MKLTSKSTDKQIVKWLSSVNKKITGYYGVDDTVGEQFAHQVEQQLTWRKYHKGEFGVYDEWELPLEEKRGKLQIDLKTKAGKQTAIAHVRRILAEAEDKDAESTVQDKIDAMPTISEKRKIVEKQMTEEGKAFSTDTPMGKYDPVFHDQGKRAYNADLKEAVTREIIERATREWEDDFSDVIDLLYEDEAANNDIIAKLDGGQWTPEIMEEANVRAHGMKRTRH